MLARLVRLAAGIAVLILVVGIAIRLFDIRSALVTDAARWLDRPFRSVFSANDPKLEVALDYGLAAVVYSVAAAVVTSLLARAASAGPLGRRR